MSLAQRKGSHTGTFAPEKFICGLITAYFILVQIFHLISIFISALFQELKTMQVIENTARYYSSGIENKLHIFAIELCSRVGLYVVSSFPLVFPFD